MNSSTDRLKSCQEGKNNEFGVSNLKEGGNKSREFVGTPPLHLIS
jgi:hypothetical protein